MRNAAAGAQDVLELHARDHGQVANDLGKVLRHALVARGRLGLAALLNARAMRGEHGLVHARVQTHLGHVGGARLLHDLGALAVDVARVVDELVVVADLVQIVVERMGHRGLAAAAEDHAAHAHAEELGVLAAAQQADDLVVGVEVLDHDERAVGADVVKARKVHRAARRDSERHHVDALLVKAAEQALAALALECLLVVKDLVGALTARGIRHLALGRGVEPRHDGRHVVVELAGRAAVAAARALGGGLARIDLDDVSADAVDLGERARARDGTGDLEARGLGGSERTLGRPRRRHLGLGRGSRLALGLAVRVLVVSLLLFGLLARTGLLRLFLRSGTALALMLALVRIGPTGSLLLFASGLLSSVSIVLGILFAGGGLFLAVCLGAVPLCLRRALCIGRLGGLSLRRILGPARIGSLLSLRPPLGLRSVRTVGLAAMHARAASNLGHELHGLFARNILGMRSSHLSRRIARARISRLRRIRR